MNKSRIVVILLLVSVMTVISNASSQQLTTSTSLLTTLTNQLSTEYFSSYEATTSVGTGVETLTERSLSRTASAPCKIVLLGSFNATGGDEHFSYSVETPTTLYVLSSLNRGYIGELLTATTIPGCNALISAFGLPSYTREIPESGSGSFDLTLLQADNPYITAMIAANSTIPNGSLTISPVFGTYTYPLTITFVQTMSLTFNTTLSLTVVTKVQSYHYANWLLGVVIVSLALCLVFILRRRKDARQST